MTPGQRCQCGHTRGQHSEWTTTAGCLACTSCDAAAGPHVVTRCECTTYTPEHEDKNDRDNPKPIGRLRYSYDRSGPVIQTA